MYRIARLPAGVIFLAFLIPSIFTWIDWRIAALGSPVMLGWLMHIRWTLSESKDYLSRPIYLSLATISLFSFPLLGVIGFILGNSDFERIANTYEPYIWPAISVAALFVYYSGWTAAEALVISEESGVADRAVRWERTVKTFMALIIWPVGVWSVQRRVLAAVG